MENHRLGVKEIHSFCHFFHTLTSPHTVLEQLRDSFCLDIPLIDSSKRDKLIKHKPSANICRGFPHGVSWWSVLCV